MRQPSSAVVDLNLFVSALISSLGQPRRLLNRFQSGDFILVICNQLRHELGEVLRREKLAVRFGITAEIRDTLLTFIDSKAAFVAPVSPLDITVRDPKDGIVLATALGGRADYLVTGDADLLVLRDDPRVGTLRIVTVREFLELLDDDVTEATEDNG
jgi:putative PIN family toxin of toxin-antitoxin system